MSEAHIINGFHSTHAKPWLLREEGEQYTSANSTHALFAYCEVNEGIVPPDVVTENGVALAPFEKNNGAKLQAAFMRLAQSTICCDEPEDLKVGVKEEVLFDYRLA